MAKINAYQAWLGIPPEQQPPHHYRLLGIELFETDPAVIERAGDRQMSYIRSLKLGENVELAEKLLGQISTAKLCLLDADRKHEYDVALRRKQSSKADRPLKVAAPRAMALPTSVAPPSPSPPASMPVAVASPTPVVGGVRKSTSTRRRQSSSQMPLLLGGGAVLLLLLGGAFFAASQALDNEQNEVAQATTPTVPEEPPVEQRDKPAVDTGKTASDTPPRVQPASAKIDLPFASGKIGSGQQVLSDRNFAFGKVAPQLAGLAFTKHRFGAIGALKFNATSDGTLYAILPPRKYAEPLPDNVRVPGWSATELECEVVIDGKSLPCLVLQLESSKGATGQIPASPSVWPIIAGKGLVSTRPAEEIASSDPPEDEDDTVEEDDPPTIAINDAPFGVDDPPSGTGNSGSKPKPAARPKPPAAADAAPLRERVAAKFSADSLETVDDKLSASRALVSMAEDAATPSDERYVALLVGAELAADAGELPRALEVIAQIDGSYEGGTLDKQLDAVRRFIAASAPRAAKEQQLASIVPVIERAISAEKFDDVDEIVQDLLKSRLNSPVLGEQRKRATALRDKYVKDVVPAMKVLETKPDDPEANRVVGDYQAIGLQDWPKALPMLAKGDDPLLARVAKSELANPQRADDQLVVAQGWRSAFNERVGATERGPLMLHAEAWYNKAYPGLAERDRQRAREQLGKLQEDMDKMKWPAPTRKVTIFASCGEAFNIAINGRIVLSGTGPGVHSLQTDINQGDIILVQAQKALPIREGGVATTEVPLVGGGTGRRVERYSADPARRKGFACAVVFEGSTRHIATGAAGSPWRSFVTESAAAWHDPKFVRAFDEVMVGGTTGGQQELIAQSQTNVASIWGGTSPFEAYLFCKVP